jgi:hydrogenase-4 component B
VLVTLGFYGLARFLPMLAADPRPWALALMALGALGAAGGIVMALSQRDVKRVLAYSTIENAGLIAIGIGLALFAGASGDPALAALAWTAALLHLWNHAIAKSALFLSAGGLAAQVGSRDLELWGGLLRRLPVTGGALLVGAAAMAGLPGTNVFASEWLLIVSLFRGAASLTGPGRVTMLLELIAVTFTAGAALACFVRLAGIGLLGHPRSASAADPRPAGARLAIAIVFPAALCLALVAALPALLSLLGGAAAQLAHRAPDGSVARLAAP